MATSNVDAIVAKFVSDLERIYRSQAQAVVQEALRTALAEGEVVKHRRVTTRRRGSPPRARARTSTMPPRAAKSKRIRRTLAELEHAAHRVLDYVRKNPGQRSEAIRAALRLDKNQWTTTIAQLIEKGQVKSRGEKRLTTYTAI